MWVVDDGPRGGDTAYVNTWALGRLAQAPADVHLAGHAVVAGDRTVRYRVNAGLHGKAKATLAGDAAPEGTIDVSVAEAPAATRVDPETGDVLREGEPRREVAQRAGAAAARRPGRRSAPQPSAARR